MRRTLGAAVLLVSGVAVAETTPPAAQPANPPAVAPAKPAAPPKSAAPPASPPATSTPTAPAPSTPAPSTAPAPGAPPTATAPSPAQPAPGTAPEPVAPAVIEPDPAPAPPSTPPPATPPSSTPLPPERSESLPRSSPTAQPSERAEQTPPEPSAWQDGHAIAVEAVARVGGRLGSAAYAARSEERAGLGYKFAGYFTLSPSYLVGFGLARQDLGELVVSEGATTASAGYASTALELGARAFPFRRDGFDLYVGLHVGLAWQDVEATGLAAPEGFQPGRVFHCSDLAGPSFGLGAEVGAGLELTRALWLTGTLDASGYRHSADIVGECVAGIGSVTTLSFGAGLLYAFDIGRERALAPKREARR